MSIAKARLRIAREKYKQAVKEAKASKTVESANKWWTQAQKQHILIIKLEKLARRG